MDSLSFVSIAYLREQLDTKKISHAELLEYFLQRMYAHNPSLGALLEVFEHDTVVQASAGAGLLHAIPGVIKDNISQSGRRLSCGSNVLHNFVATYDATAIARLKQQGAYIAGRTNLDEFAMGSSCETSAFYPAHNPWDTTRVPGGSSGGSIAAVAAGLVPWALGTDTGGSVRQPAALCGIVGLKPTYGLVSRYGVVAYASSLDQIGIATRTVRDNALILSVIAGNDPHDSSSLPIHQHDYTQKLNGKMPKEITIGIIDNALYAEGVDPEIVQAIEQAITELERLGARIKHVKLPALEYSAAAYFIISRAEAASNLARFDGVRYGLRDQEAKTLVDMYCQTRAQGFGPEVTSRIMVGNYVLSAGYADAFYENAKKVQQLLRGEFESLFADVDVLVMPTHPEPAFKLGQYSVDPLKIDLQDYFTCSINLAGVPAISLPCGFTQNKLPIGFQLIGPHCAEERIYQVADAYEQATPWHTHHPSGF